MAMFLGIVFFQTVGRCARMSGMGAPGGETPDPVPG